METYKPGKADPWDGRKAAHLLNRAGFGGTPQDVAELAHVGYDAAVDRLLNFQQHAEDYPPPDWATNPPEEMKWPEKARQKYRDLPEAERREKFMEFQRIAFRDIQELKMWWLKRMCVTPRPFQEKMTLFWHGHFTSSAADGMNPLWLFKQNDLFRRMAIGNFKELTLEISKNPAMLRYLDNVSNRKQHPNENYARELMELFTLGIGNYTEKDIKESARAFSGWGIRGTDFFFMPFSHDYDEKTFLGHTGNFNGTDIVDIIFEQPATSRYIAKKLWRFFAYEDPEPEVIEDLSATLRDSKFELKPVMRAIFTSKAFYSDKAIRMQIKSPTQLAVGIVRLLKMDNARLPAVAQMMRQMGQDLLFPPNVKGWDGGKAWINTSTLFVRYNLAKSLVSGSIPEGMGGGRSAGGGQRREEMMMAGRLPEGFTRPGTAKIDHLFDRAKIKTAEDAVDQAARALVHDKMPEDQRAELVKFLNTSAGGAEDKFDPAGATAEEKLRALVYLIMSSPVYQLC